MAEKSNAWTGFPHLPVAAAAVVLSLGGTAGASDEVAYRDDRSTPEAVVESLYNAVERKEYLRAWSYFRDEPDRPGFESFARGYESTEHVRLRLGRSSSDGAAGSLYYAVPAVVEAETSGGRREVFAGCYVLRLVQPAAQIEPPFQPMGIVKGELKPSDLPFDAAEGSCAGIP